MVATVPVYDAQKAQAGGSSNARFGTPDYRNVMGNKLSSQPNRIGEVVTKAVIGLQEMANQTRINDAINQAKEAALDLKYGKERGYTNLKGVEALQRPGNKPLGDEYGDHLKQSFAGIEAKLGNDAQRQAFREWADGFSVGFREDLMQYEAKQFNDYSLSVSTGVINNAQNTIGYEWHKPEVVDGEVQRIQAEVFRLGRLQGLSAEQIEANQRTATSSAHALVVVSALQNNDPAYADMYLNKYASQMDANDLLKVRGLVTTEMDNQVGLSVANEVFEFFDNKLSASDFDRAFDILIGTESGGKQFDKYGKPLTSSAGAKGIAQVMRKTGPEAARLAGREWDEALYENDLEYNKALGRAYFKEQLRVNGGDLAKAYAAYNGGPGRLKEALQKAQKPENAGRSWLDFMAGETRDYVLKNMKEFNQGQMRRSEPSLKEIMDQISKDPRVANNPNRLKVAKGEVERQYKEQQAEIKQKEEATVREAQIQLQANGGRYENLPLELRNNIPSDKVPDLIAYGQNVNNPYAVYSNHLLYLQLSDPVYLKRLTKSDLELMKSELTQEDFKFFVRQRSALIDRDTVEARSAETINFDVVNKHLNNVLEVLKININPPAYDRSAVARLAAIRQNVYETVLEEQALLRRQLTERETYKLINELSMMSVTKPKEIFSGEKNLSLFTVQARDIPDAEKRLWKSAFKRSGIDNPTEEQIQKAKQKKVITEGRRIGRSLIIANNIFKDLIDKNR